MHLVISNCSGVGENCAALLCEGEPRGKHGTDLLLRVEPVCCGEVVTGLCVCAVGGLSSSCLSLSLQGPGIQWAGLPRIL